MEEHGTRGGYQRHMREKSVPCQPCRDAAASDQKNRRSALSLLAENNRAEFRSLIEKPQKAPKTTASFMALSTSLGINQQNLSRIFGIQERAVTRWQLGENPIPPGIWDELETIETHTQEIKNQLAKDCPIGGTVLVPKHAGNEGTISKYGVGWWRVVAASLLPLGVELVSDPPADIDPKDY